LKIDCAQIFQKKEQPMQKITPFLWFNNTAEDAVELYTSIFKNSKVISTQLYPEGSLGPQGTVMTVEFQLEGQRFIALNGGPMFTFSPAISFFVDCNTQEEVDDLWEKLSAGGEIQQCGWLKDKYGISWQIVPTCLMELLHGNDTGKSKRAMEAMLTMTKLDISALQKAYAGV
jgi:predicted 3-demethylubiquinone-9 3-methyltransferase (glyoxalase superfamily)